MSDMTIDAKKLAANSITFSSGGLTTQEVMRISADGITVPPGVHVDDAAKAVIEALEKHIAYMVAVQRAKVLEEAADAVGEVGDHADVGAYIRAIRALQDKP